MTKDNMNMTNERIQTKSKHTSPPGLLALVLMTVFIAAFPRPADAACSNPTGIKADIVYNSSQKLFEYCNDTNWVRMNPRAGSGTGGCTNPAMDEGKMVYNADHRVMQGCAGNVWRALGPVGASSLTGWKKISMGENHGCLIDLNDKLFCWGNNSGGKLGNGVNGGSEPVPIAIATSDTWKEISAGEGHTCGIKSDNTAWCWGENAWGELGDASYTTRTTPVAISGGGSWKQIGAGSDTSCGLKTDNTAWCWGYGPQGNRGDGTTTSYINTPVAVVGGHTWKMLGMGARHACGITSTDAAYCWGFGQNGRMGNGTTTNNNPTPVLVSGGFTWKYISSGYNHSCGITSANALYCWGYNLYGQVGDGTSTNPKSSPVLVLGGFTWKSVDTARGFFGGFTCGTKTDDTMACWGTSSSNQLGDGVVSYSYTPVTVAGGHTAKAIELGASHTCALKLNNEMICWGNPSSIPIESQNLLIPNQVAGNHSWKDIKASSYFTCGVKTDDSLMCWGTDGSGQIGNGATTGNQYSPATVSGGSTWKMVTNSPTNSSHVCGIKFDDTAWCWGADSSGQLGDDVSLTNKDIPTAVAGGGTWKYLTTGAAHTCGIKSDDTLWCWGSDGSGQIGNGSTTGNQPTPVAVTGGGTWKYIAAGTSHTCGIKSDNTAWCWGSDSNGQVGNGATTGNQIDPVAVTGGYTWKSLAASFYNTCGLQTDNTAWCWGNDSSNQLGNGPLVSNQESPVAVIGGHYWKTISINSGTGCAIKTDNTGWCWGGATYGDGPTLIPGGSLWSSLSTSNGHICGVSGTTGFCWITNIYGEAGIGPPLSITPSATLCGAPQGKPGAIIYNSSANIMQYCVSGGWVAFGGYGAGSNPGPTDPCAGSPNPGDVCADGTVYAGLTPDGNVAMYTTRCDAGQTWDGSSCINARQTMPWNNGQADWVDAPIAECGSFASCGVSGKTNTPLLATSDSDSNDPGTQPHDAAKYCDDLVLHGQSDWYLPSIAELVLIHGNKVSIGQFDTTVSSFYASSSENAPTSTAWSQNFNNGTYGALPKDIDFFVRCARQ